MSEELELLEAAKSISKQIHERSDEIEKARRVPADISDQMAKGASIRGRITGMFGRAMWYVGSSQVCIRGVARCRSLNLFADP